MSSVVALRKLSFKSKMNFGKHAEQTVEHLIEANPYYLVWVYYNMDKISFIDEVLDKLKVCFPKFTSIVKPGKVPELHDVVCKPEVPEGKKTYSECTYKELKNMILSYRIRGVPVPPRLKECYNEKRTELFFANKNKPVFKATLQARNHGR